MKKEKIELLEEIGVWEIFGVVLLLILGVLIFKFVGINLLLWIIFLLVLGIMTLVVTIFSCYEYFILKKEFRDIYFNKHPKLRFWLVRIITLLIIILYILVLVVFRK